MAYNFKSQIETIEKIIPHLYCEIYIPIGDLSMEAYVTEEPVSFDAKTSGEKKFLRKGDVWGKLWDCGWFHFTGSVPPAAKGEKVVLYIDIHGELEVYNKDGVALRGLTSGSCLKVSGDFGCFGIRKRTYPICDSAKGGEVIDLWADAGCNYITGDGGGQRPDVGKIEFADICICRDNVKALFYDFLVLYDLMKEIPSESARCHRLRQSLFEAASCLYDYSDEEIEKASDILKKELDKKSGDTDLTFTALGHAHIDLAWHWPLRETMRKAVRTFTNGLRSMEQYPDYRFGASQVPLYAWVKELQPKVYEQVKERVKEGRWEVQGAMWCEPDANITGGESFVRQILYGKRFFRQEFGEDMKVLWLPDVFGYSAALPQILKKSGVPYFLTIKLDWGNRHNAHPHNTFVWKGIDGSEILAHMPPEGDYNSFGMPSNILVAEHRFKDKAVCEDAMILYGVGDGGGGAGEMMHESMKRIQNLSGLSKTKQGRAIDFFHTIAKKRENYATYSGELYLELHQGTYTTQAKNKWYNRKMEKLLREAEFAAVVTGKEYPREILDRVWKEVMLYQFHDILPGSSIKRVYEESLARYQILYEEIQALITSLYGNGAYAINSLSWDRCGWEKIDGKWYYLTVPAMGSCLLIDGVESKETVNQQTNVLENDCVKVLFDTDGTILSVYDKQVEREILAEKSNRFSVYFDDGDAWDMQETYREREPKVFQLVKAEAFIDGPQKGIRQEYKLGESTLWQAISIMDGSPIVKFATKVDWQERAKMLRTAFYTTMVAKETICDIQYGFIKRPNHDNTSWDMAKFELCAHKYADISESGYGVALMNDSKYGYCVKGGMLDLNLLRSTNFPGIDADKGKHQFNYALYPHIGRLEHSDVIQKSYEFNQPLMVGEKQEQLCIVSNPDIVIESVKKAEDSDTVIVRMYETKGGTAQTALHFSKLVKSAYIVDLMEENQEPVNLNEITFHPFEIVTVMVEF